MAFSRKSSSLLFILTSFLFLCLATQSQEQNLRTQAPPQLATVKVNTLVLDDKNRPVADLRQEDFQVLSGNTPLPISFFSKGDLPVSYGLLVDNSGSLRTQFRDVLEAGRFIISNQRAGDESFLIRFISSDKIDLASDFTTERTLLLDKLNTFQTEGGQTAIIDTLYFSADHLAKSEQEKDLTRRRRALILITDGEDRNSHFSKKELLKILQESNIQLFAIGLTKELDKEGGITRKSPRERAIALLEELTDATGGRAFFPESSSALKDAVAQIVSSLHTQYVIGFSPVSPTVKASGSKTQIKLTDAPEHKKLKVVTGPGQAVP